MLLTNTVFTLAFPGIKIFYRCKVKAFLRIHARISGAAAKLLPGYPWIQNKYGSVGNIFF
jgi:hypothetical protein